MSAHADILRPKFDLVSKILEEELSDLAIADWTKPNGGYFVSSERNGWISQRNCASSERCWTYTHTRRRNLSYGIDPKDKNIRIAPTFAKLSELESAMKF